MKFRQKIAQFMYGRRGADEFSRFLLVLTLVLLLLSGLLGGVAGSALSLLALASLVYSYVRIFSRNIYKRQGENARYLKQRARVTTWFRSLRDRWQQRKDYKFFRCPSCHKLLRVPRHKGKLLLTCRQCGSRFEKKT